jgi:integrase
LHLVGTLGEPFVVGGLRTPDLQRHIDRRSPTVEAVTMKKEISTLAAAWNWALHAGLVEGKFPAKGLVYPKEDEKPPFMTWQEIERRIAAGGDAAQLWDCLYLSVAEVAELLEHVKKHARHPFIYAMFCFAAHTGARRSELLRAEVQDVEFAGEAVTIREKKRVRGKRTTRRVPLSPFLMRMLREWLASHPGSRWLFCAPLHIPGSRKHRQAYCPLTAKEAWGHFLQTLADSKWEVLRGWHVLRHSFISNCASLGIDQRLIDEWSGHQTEEMRRRYRHLFPAQQQTAIRLVFGGGQ